VLLGALGAVAAVLLVLRGLWSYLRRPPLRWIVVDGSNVMHWDANVPGLAVVAEVLADLTGRGFHPVVWFDANAGYKVADRYMGPDALARHLPIPASRIFVAPKGTPADPLLLDSALRLGARVVTNDRFRDWAEAHPMVNQQGFLVQGMARDGAVRLHF
jgi:hypothetical protein